MTSPVDSPPALLAEAARDSDATPAEPPAAASQSPQTTPKPAPSDTVASPGPSGHTAEDDAKEEGEADDDDATDTNGKPTPASTTSQPAGAQPPLPAEPCPEQSQSQGDDGWDFMWHAEAQRYYFFNRLTGESTWENPRVTASSSTTATADAATGPQPPAAPPLPTAAGGYNPAIHGDYDTWYAQNGPKQEEDDDDETSALAGLADPGQLMSGAAFNRVTGRPQRPDQGADWHGDEGRARRQMSSFFDVDAAANAHDGRSLKAERAGKRLTKGELKHFREKRKAKREEKKRAWLRD